MKSPVLMNRVLLLIIACATLSIFCYGQDVEDIVASAIQKTGGAAGWSKIQGFKVVAKFDQGGIDYPLEIVKLADGRQYTKLTFQGTEIKQGVFDGKTLWSTDFQTQKPVKSDTETTANIMLDSNDFPNGLYNYKQKGYQVTLVGTAKINNVNTYKVALKREQMMVDGVRSDDISYYYFSVDSYLPVAWEFEMKQGPIKGSTMVIKLGDYREVQGLYFPFSMSQGVKDAPSQPLKVETIEIDPRINQEEFRFQGQ